MRTRSVSKLNKPYQKVVGVFSSLRISFAVRLIAVCLLLASFFYLLCQALTWHEKNIAQIRQAYQGSLEKTALFLAGELHSIREMFDQKSSQSRKSYAEWRMLHETLQPGIFDAVAWVNPASCATVRSAQIATGLDLNCLVGDPSRDPASERVSLGLSGEGVPYLRMQITTSFGLLVGGVLLDKDWFNVHPSMQRLQKRWQLKILSIPTPDDHKIFQPNLEPVSEAKLATLYSQNWVISFVGTGYSGLSNLTFVASLYFLFLAIGMLTALSAILLWKSKRLEERQGRLQAVFSSILSQPASDGLSVMHNKDHGLPGLQQVFAYLASYQQVLLQQISGLEQNVQSLSSDKSDLLKEVGVLQDKLSSLSGLQLMGHSTGQLIEIASHDLATERGNLEVISEDVSHKLSRNIEILLALVSEFEREVSKQGARRYLRSLAEKPSSKADFKHELSYQIDIWSKTLQNLSYDLGEFNSRVEAVCSVMSGREKRYLWIHQMMTMGEMKRIQLIEILEQISQVLFQPNIQDIRFNNCPQQLWITTRTPIWWVSLLQLASQLFVAFWGQQKSNYFCLSFYSMHERNKPVLQIGVQVFCGLKSLQANTLQRKIEFLLETHHSQAEVRHTESVTELAFIFNQALIQDCGLDVGASSEKRRREQSTERQFLQ